MFPHRYLLESRENKKEIDPEINRGLFYRKTQGKGTGINSRSIDDSLSIYFPFISEKLKGNEAEVPEGDLLINPLSSDLEIHRRLSIHVSSLRK